MRTTAAERVIARQLNRIRRDLDTQSVFNEGAAARFRSTVENQSRMGVSSTELFLVLLDATHEAANNVGSRGYGTTLIEQVGIPATMLDRFNQRVQTLYAAALSASVRYDTSVIAARQGIAAAQLEIIRESRSVAA